MKTQLLIITLALACIIPPCFGQFNTSKDRIAKSNRFTFHSNFWINMHHFLYQQAKNRRVARKYAQPEREILAKLPKLSKVSYDEAIAFYKKHLINKYLTFNRKLIEIRKTLILNQSKKKLRGKTLEKPLAQVLSKFAPVYKKHFWALHHRSNKQLIKAQLKTIKKFENKVFDLLAKWAQNPWKKGKIRVDMTRFANWAGAYTSNNPTIVTLSSIDDQHSGSLFVEILFHEPTHSIISSRRYAVANTIKEVVKKSGKQAPRSFWHFVLFYFAGKATQMLYEKEGTTHRLYMQKRIVSPHNFELMEKYFTPYFTNQVTLKQAISSILAEWKPRQRKKR